jgi:indole-3-glycerol phosphate synthase
MTILDKIIAYKQNEVLENQKIKAIKELEKSLYFNKPTKSLKKAIQTKSGIIAEFKRKSPSKGIINDFSKVKSVVLGYEKAGVSGLSILTDFHFFGGTTQDILEARKVNSQPILRKDFIISEYQIIEAKAMGADVILLIASVLSKKEIIHFTNFAHNLGLEVLFEVHTQEELDKYIPKINLVGINNRNLKTFEVNFENSIKLSKQLPSDTIKIAESGISDFKNIITLKKHGFEGFLIGENFMKTKNPALACDTFIHNLKNS